MPPRISLHPRLNFAKLLNEIQPTAGELKKAQSYALSCRKRLNQSFDLKAFKMIGSHARKDAIRHYSDLDFMVVLATNERKWGERNITSTTLTQRVAQDLDSRYVSTDVRRDKQAIVVSFGGGQNSMDVVPAVFYGFNKEHKKPVYHIPDGYGEWLETSPDAHNSYILRASSRSRGKLAKVSQLVRYWKNCRAKAIPISSFYISLLLANSNICTGAKSYPEIIHEFFKLMKQRECRGIRDPVGIAGNIYAVQTQAQGKSLINAIDKAYQHSAKALQAENAKDFSSANQQWNLVFNRNFI